MSKPIGRTFLASAACLASLAIATLSHAEPAPTPPPAAFGTRGHLVLDGLLGLSLSSVGATSRSGLLFVPLGWVNGWRTKSTESVGDTEYTMENTSFAVAPSMDYFVTDRVSVGGKVVGAWLHQKMNSQDPYFSDDARDYYVSLTPRVGVTWPVSEDITFWTRLGAGVLRGYSSYGDHEENETEWRANAEALFVVRASQSLFFSLGPALTARKFLAKDDATGATVRDVFIAGGYMTGTVGLVL